MKEQTLIEMKNKVDAIVNVMQRIIADQQHLTTLSAGTLEAVKLMPGYDDAIKALTERAGENLKAKEKISDELKHVADSIVEE
jgi:peptidyl-tRNA hydrolase